MSKTTLCAPNLRTSLAALARESVHCGLNQGTSGNVSVRSRAGFLITPSGQNMAALTGDDMVEMGMDGGVVGEVVGAGKPSSEWRFHRDIYAAFPEAEAVVHAHSPFAVALACLRRDIPAFHYMVAMAGGVDIRCAAYATFGTQALSDVVLLALQDRRACLMANHGLLAWGRNLPAALALANEVEALCGQYLRACQIGEPVLLSHVEMQEVLEKFKDYGKQD
jgi:L-fuculose-phosphate aldolase